MKNLKTTKLLFISIMMLIIVSMSQSFPVYASENGVFTTTNITNYINPDTGVTDDGGTQNIAIGEGMCRSIIDETTLIEVVDDRFFATIRMHLYENIPNITFKVQGVKGDANSYLEVTHEIIQEDFYADFADLRFEIPDVATLIQCTAYITPMGRDVCFYFEIGSELTQYTGDDYVFLTEDEVAKMEESQFAQNEFNTEETANNIEENQANGNLIIVLISIFSVIILILLICLAKRGKRNVK